MPTLQLSPEVRDLLDHILVPKEEERITIPEIEAHPWCANCHCLGYESKEARACAIVCLNMAAQRHLTVHALCDHTTEGQEAAAVAVSGSSCSIYLSMWSTRPFEGAGFPLLHIQKLSLSQSDHN